MMFFKKWFDKSPIIKFKSFIGDFSIATPIVIAGKIKAKWRTTQTDNKFDRCPGMWDYANAGYIITAHTDIHIKANKVGVIIKVGSNITELQPQQFEFNFVDGMTTIDNVKQYAAKVPLPWSIQAKSGYSAYVMPAIMHVDYLDKIFIYPGIVDFDKFHTINFAFSPIKECEFTIYAGTPILQVIPFKREKITAECGKTTDAERDRHIFNFPSKMRNYYRKFLYGRKSYTMKCPHNHRG